MRLPLLFAALVAACSTSSAPPVDATSGARIVWSTVATVPNDPVLGVVALDPTQAVGAFRAWAQSGKQADITVPAYDDGGAPTPTISTWWVPPDDFLTKDITYLPRPGADAIVAVGSVPVAGGVRAAVQWTIDGQTVTLSDLPAPIDGVTLNSVARFGRDGLIAVGSGGTVVHTVADGTGHHDLTQWVTVSLPFAAGLAVDLNAVTRAGSGNVVVGKSGQIFVYRPEPLGRTAAAPWQAWHRLTDFGTAQLHSVTVDDVVRTGAIAVEDDSFWEPQPPVPGLVGYGHPREVVRMLLTNFQFQVIRFSLDMTAECPSGATSPCATSTPMSKTIVQGTGLWGNSALRHMAVDEHLRVGVGIANRVWVFPKAAPIHTAGMWANNPAASAGYNRVATNGSTWVLAGGNSSGGVLQVGGYDLPRCTATATRTGNVLSFSVPADCQVLGATVQSAARPTSPLDPSETDVLISQTTGTWDFTVTFPSPPPGNALPAVQVSLIGRASGGAVQGRAEVEVLFPRVDTAAIPVYGGGAVATWEQALAWSAGQLDGFVYRRNMPTFQTPDEPIGDVRAAVGTWVDALTLREGPEDYAAPTAHALDTCGDIAASSTLGAGTTGAADDASALWVSQHVVGIGKFRSAWREPVVDDYEAWRSGLDAREVHMSTTLLGRCQHDRLPGLPFPDDGYAASCCDTEGAAPVAADIPVYAPFRGRLVSFGRSDGAAPADGVYDPANLDWQGIGHLQGALDFGSEAEPAPISCPITGADAIGFGPGTTEARYSRDTGPLYLLWEPDEADGDLNGVALRLDHVESCLPVNGSLVVDPGTRIGFFSAHTSAEISLLVNDHHEKWRAVDYLEAIPDAHYEDWQFAFGLAPRPPSEGGGGPQHITSVSLDDRDRCPADHMPWVCTTGSTDAWCTGPSHLDDLPTTLFRSSPIQLACYVPGPTGSPVPAGGSTCPTAECQPVCADESCSTAQWTDACSLTEAVANSPESPYPNFYQSFGQAIADEAVTPKWEVDCPADAFLTKALHLPDGYTGELPGDGPEGCVAEGSVEPGTLIPPISPGTFANVSMVGHHFDGCEYPHTEPRTHYGIDINLSVSGAAPQTTCYPDPQPGPQGHYLAAVAVADGELVDFSFLRDGVDGEVSGPSGSTTVPGYVQLHLRPTGTCDIVTYNFETTINCQIDPCQACDRWCGNCPEACSCSIDSQNGWSQFTRIDIEPSDPPPAIVDSCELSIRAMLAHDSPSRLGLRSEVNAWIDAWITYLDDPHHPVHNPDGVPKPDPLPVTQGETILRLLRGNRGTGTEAEQGTHLHFDVRPANTPGQLPPCPTPFVGCHPLPPPDTGPAPSECCLTQLPDSIQEPDPGACDFSDTDSFDSIQDECGLLTDACLTTASSTPPHPADLEENRGFPVRCHECSAALPDPPDVTWRKSGPFCLEAVP